ncbi:MAG TPA: hypothetical protein VGQ25_10310 [Gemmatimonadales bacterium]|jgi:hypothetical protein|nr:hypothetical protein [Gemmatimonadales bacterium]
MLMRRIALTAVVLLVCAGGVSRAAAQRSHFGLHGGYNFDLEEGLIGAQIHMPLTPSIELYPSFDYYFVDAGTLLGFNGDLKFRTPGAPLYFGGGLNVLHTTGNSDTGFDLFGGFETRYGRTHPYVEGRGLFHDGRSFQLLFGLNITLY